MSSKTCIKYNPSEEADDDDMLLADIMSLKISTPTEEKSPVMFDNNNMLWNDWAYQQQQIQASYYQLQYLQQQQMMSMMRNSTSSCSSKRSSTSSTNSNSTYYRSSKRNSSRNVVIPHKISTVDHEPIKRRQSLSKRIKKVFGMTEESSNLIEKTVDLPASPNSVSSRHKRDSNKYRKISPYIEIPSSPASSTVSTVSTTSSKKSLSFNPVIKINETFSSSEYDRRSDMNATCQKLTPDLALKIKEELNNFKLNDMFVHNESRQYTHFFM